MILVGIGANLPAPDGAPARATCEQAAAALAALPGLRLAAVAHWWETDAIPPDPDAPPFVNGVAALEGEADPAVLLAALHAIETRFGRARPYPNAPRTLDLDLLDMHGLVRDAPDPVLPHPRLHLRRFVLAPLLEVAPGWVHPRLGPGAALLAAVAHQAARRLDQPVARCP